MKTLLEVVKTFDVDAFRTRNGEAFRFRLEVVRDLGGPSYKGKVYRLETYRLQPTFPQSKGRLPDFQNDALIYVADDMFDSNVLTGGSVEEVVEKFHRMFDDIFARSKEP